MKKSNEEKRVVIYCRESRDDYGENYERIEAQRDLLVKYCKSHGYTNIVDIIMDDDKSGTDFSIFDYIRERAKNKEIDVIVFKNSARLGRNQKEALVFVEYLEEQGVEIISKLFDKIVVFDKQEITEDIMQEYNLNDEMYNELYENGGLAFHLKFMYPQTITNMGLRYLIDTSDKFKINEWIQEFK